MKQRYVEMLEEFFRRKSREHQRCACPDWNCIDCEQIKSIEAEQVRLALWTLGEDR